MNNKKYKLLDNMLFNEDLVLLQIQAKTDQEIINIIARTMYSVGVVKDSFVQAVREREEAYPTGLELSDMGIAIPHTFAEHVNQPALSLGILDKPVPFKCMGEPDKKVNVQIVFMLGIIEPQVHLIMLQRLIQVFQTDGKLKELLSVKTPGEAVTVLTRLLEE